eukprot:gene2823-1808_t
MGPLKLCVVTTNHTQNHKVPANTTHPAHAVQPIHLANSAQIRPRSYNLQTPSNHHTITHYKPKPNSTSSILQTEIVNDSTKLTSTTIHKFLSQNKSKTRTSNVKTVIQTLQMFKIKLNQIQTDNYQEIRNTNNSYLYNQQANKQSTPHKLSSTSNQHRQHNSNTLVSQDVNNSSVYPALTKHYDHHPQANPLTIAYKPTYLSVSKHIKPNNITIVHNSIHNCTSGSKHNTKLTRNQQQTTLTHLKSLALNPNHPHKYLHVQLPTNTQLNATQSYLNSNNPTQNAQQPYHPSVYQISQQTQQSTCIIAQHPNPQLEYTRPNHSQQETIHLPKKLQRLKTQQSKLQTHPNNLSNKTLTQRASGTTTSLHNSPTRTQIHINSVGNRTNYTQILHKAITNQQSELSCTYKQQTLNSPARNLKQAASCNIKQQNYALHTQKHTFHNAKTNSTYTHP